jgi:perosamine synthetase
MIITSDENLAARARKFSILGYTTLSARQDAFKTDIDRAQHPSFKRHEMMGFNYRLPEVCAAMGVAQLEKLDMLIDMRKKIGALYQEAVKGCPWIQPQKNPEGLVNSYWTYVFAIDTKKVSWEQFRKTFLELGGERFYGAWSLTYLEPFLNYERGLCPIAEELQPRLIQLKTNFGDLEYAKKQAEILQKTIHTLS